MKIANLLRRAAAMLLAVLIPASSMPVLALSGGTNVTTTPAQQFCGATIRLSGSDYLCAVDLGTPVIDSGSDTAMTAGTTVRLDLFFSINDSWYACRKQEMQGDPNTLFTVRFIRDQGADRVSDPVWKTYPDDGYGERYYLEFTVIGGDTDAPVDVSIALTQPDASNVGAQYRITGTSAAYGTCTAEFDLPGYSGPCDVYLGDPVTSTGDPAAMVPGSTVCFPLMFLGGDGELYAAYSTEMRGDPNDLFTVEGSGEPLLTCSGWKTWENHHWYLEYTVGQGEPGDPLTLRVRLRQSEAYKATPWKPFDGGMGQKGPCVAPISIGGTVYDCTVDLQNAVTSTGDDQNMTAGSTVCFPLVFLADDGSWYPVLRDELQGEPDSLFALSETISSGEALLTRTGWKTWPSGQYYLEYEVADSQYETPLCLSVRLKQDAAYRQGTAVAFSGTAPASDDPVWKQCTAPISINGEIYDCVVDLRGYLTSTGGETLEDGSTVCFPLMFLGSDGAWYPVLRDELQGDPAELFTVAPEFTSGSASFVGWETWENGHYYAAFKVSAEQTEMELDFTAQLKQGEERCGTPVVFHGSVAAKQIYCSVPIKLGDTVYPCLADFGAPLTSTGGTDLEGTNTIAFPLQFLGGDGKWYPVLASELQGEPEMLLEVQQTITSGAQWFGKPVWKHDWPNGAYYLEYKMLDPDEKQKIEVSVQLFDGTNTTLPQTFTGTLSSRAGRYVQWAKQIAEGNPARENQGKVVLIGDSHVEYWADYAYHMAPLEALDFGMGGAIIQTLADTREILTTPYAPRAVVVVAGCNNVMLFDADADTVYTALSGYLKDVLKDLPDTPVFAVSQMVNLTDTESRKQTKLEVNERIKALCDATQNLYYIDVTPGVNPDDPDEMAALLRDDGVHLNQKGYDIFGPTIADAVRKVLDVEPTDPPQRQCSVPIKIGDTVYDCTVDLQGYLTSSGSDVLAGGGTVAFPLMFLGGDGVWYPVLKGELQGNPDDLFYVEGTIDAGGTLLKKIGWKTWDTGHYYLEYAIADAKKTENVAFSVQLCQTGNRAGVPVAFRGTVPGSASETETPPAQNTSCVVPIKIDGVVYDCTVDLQGYLTSSGTDTLAGGGTVAFPLMFLGGDGEWYPVLKNELQGTPESILSVKQTIVLGGKLLTRTGWKTWDNGHWYLEYTVAGAEKDAKVEFSVRLCQSGGKAGTPVTFRGTVPGTAPGTDEPPVEENTSCVVPIKIDGTVYDCIVDLQGSLTSSGSETLAGGGTVAFPLMFLGGDGEWYPVLRDELQGDPADLFTHTMNARSGGELLTCTGWGCWDNGHYYLEYKVSAPRETARLEFGVILERNGASGAEDLFTGYVQPGPDLSDRQIPLKPSASLVVERVEECQDFNTMSFTISGVRYEDGWPIDFESPNTTSAVITDGTIIRSDLCFMVNGQWYPVRQQECNESIEDLFTYDYQVLSGGEFLTTPRFTTRYDAYGDIWQFEVAVSSEKEGEFSFTLQLKSKDGTKTGSKYKVTGRVQNGQMTSSVEELPEESGGSWLWLAIGGSCAVVAAAGVTVFFLLRRKKKI